MCSSKGGSNLGNVELGLRNTNHVNWPYVEDPVCFFISNSEIWILSYYTRTGYVCKRKVKKTWCRLVIDLQILRYAQWLVQEQISRHTSRGQNHFCWRSQYSLLSPTYSNLMLGWYVRIGPCVYLVMTLNEYQLLCKCVCEKEHTNHNRNTSSMLHGTSPDPLLKTNFFSFPQPFNDFKRSPTWLLYVVLLEKIALGIQHKTWH